MSHLAGLVYTGVPATGVLSWPSVADVARVVRCCALLVPLDRHDRILASCYNPDKDLDGGAHRLTELLSTAFGN